MKTIFVFLATGFEEIEALYDEAKIRHEEAVEKARRYRPTRKTWRKREPNSGGY